MPFNRRRGQSAPSACACPRIRKRSANFRLRPSRCSDADVFLAALRLLFKVENLRLPVLEQGEFDFRLAPFLLVFEGAALDNLPALEDGIHVFLLRFVALGFLRLLYAHAPRFAQRHPKVRFALALAALVFRFPLAAHRVLLPVYNEDAFDGVFFLRLIEIVIVVIVVVGAEGFIIVHRVRKGVAEDVLVGHFRLFRIVGEVAFALRHAERAVGEQALHEHHIFVERRDGFLVGNDAALREYCQPLRLRERLGAAAVHRGDERARRRRGKAVYIFGGGQIVEFVVVRRVVPVSSLAASRKSNRQREQCERRKDCQKCLFHFGCLLF